MKTEFIVIIRRMRAAQFEDFEEAMCHLRALCRTESYKELTKQVHKIQCQFQSEITIRISNEAEEIMENEPRFVCCVYLDGSAYLVADPTTIELAEMQIYTSVEKYREMLGTIPEELRISKRVYYHRHQPFNEVAIVEFMLKNGHRYAECDATEVLRTMRISGYDQQSREYIDRMRYEAVERKLYKMSEGKGNLFFEEEYTRNPEFKKFTDSRDYNVPVMNDGYNDDYIDYYQAYFDFALTLDAARDTC